MIKINNEIIATAEQNVVITQANYDKLTTAQKNDPLKTYFISDSSIAAQNLVSSEPVAQPLSLDDDFAAGVEDDNFAAGVDDSDGTASNGTGTEYLVALSLVQLPICIRSLVLSLIHLELLQMMLRLPIAIILA